jgi:hypothetical protein
MDIGDGFYGVGLGASWFMTVVVQLLGLIILTLGFFTRRRWLRRCLAIGVLLLLAAQHVVIASSGIGWWRKVFLGRDPEGDKAWLALGYDHSMDMHWQLLLFYSISHAYIIVCSFFMIFVFRSNAKNQLASTINK